MFEFNDDYNFTTTGHIVDTNDPQERGRVRVYCPAFGDLPSTPIELIPWAQFSTPFAGSVDNEKFSRGPESTHKTTGGVAYGMWMIPKIGAEVLVTCINNNPMLRVCIGCLHSASYVNTLPHGRNVDGVISSATEQPIEPYNTNTSKAFGSKTDSYEWATRAADRSVSKVKQGSVNAGQTVASKPDSESQGYQPSRIAPDIKYSNSTQTSLDPQIYSWTTPGFHSFTMDDSADNCRMRFRTSTGHQIILDDTNERIYISTAEGESWVELDQDGSVDIFASQKVSIHSSSDINLTSDKTVRIFGNSGIHLQTPQDIRLTSGADTHIQSGAALRLKGSSDAFVTSGGAINLLASDNIIETGAEIHLNGPAAADAATQPAHYTNRVPAHEPWGRCDTKADNGHEPKYDYKSDKIGRDNKTRNSNWKR